MSQTAPQVRPRLTSRRPAQGCSPPTSRVLGADILSGRRHVSSGDSSAPSLNLSKGSTTNNHLHLGRGSTEHREELAARGPSILHPEQRGALSRITKVRVRVTFYRCEPVSQPLFTSEGVAMTSTPSAIPEARSGHPLVRSCVARAADTPEAGLRGSVFYPPQIHVRRAAVTAETAHTCPSSQDPQMACGF
ncbi:hypothetical protein P7K49_024827 [Saguinus oedipus]|uniref:Uncharacterized protein n=1 Tax=Saguinus oedipus TaxID=9490 RepID=A0ABQ9UQL1_SAGOE|nr:hypothetical protein P7K49_024827 [Saguinus oedipus]